ncbi:hypothetical protein AS026_31710 [Rhizobium altiplani]|uniref:Uncharacterized protein n=1 Tax=Rhizobium altiplani TaxID=1864509 RepID=A0A125Q9F4_9HYPH|nr:hypothetical protein [Rhizobium altiplani]KWV57200.1 hypothetical protein AS026_31710 [Rhizobium altiplani]
MDSSDPETNKSVDEMALFAASVLSSATSSSVEISSARSVLVEVKRVSYRLATDEDVKAQYQRLAQACASRKMPVG